MSQHVYQHVFSAVEVAKGLIYGGLYLYEDFCDAARTVTNSLSRAMTALAKDSQHARIDQNQLFELVYLFRRSQNGVESLGVLFILRRGYHFSICISLGKSLTLSFVHHEVLF